MKQQYPGDIRPLMSVCAELAQRRTHDLDRVRSTVASLKSNLAQTLDTFAEMRADSAARIGALRTHTMQSLAANRRARSADIAELRARFANERAQTIQSQRHALGQFREQLDQAVSAIKTQTQSAKSVRFRSGSFSAVAEAKPVKAAVPAPKKAPAVKRNSARSFLDAIEY